MITRVFCHCQIGSISDGVAVVHFERNETIDYRKGDRIEFSLDEETISMEFDRRERRIDQEENGGPEIWVIYFDLSGKTFQNTGESQAFADRIVSATARGVKWWALWNEKNFPNMYR